MSWIVDFHPLFLKEAKVLPLVVAKGLAEEVRILEALGPLLGRPQVDTLKASQH
jgi:hypothetical protein